MLVPASGVRGLESSSAYMRYKIYSALCSTCEGHRPIRLLNEPNTPRLPLLGVDAVLSFQLACELCRAESLARQSGARTQPALVSDLQAVDDSILADLFLSVCSYDWSHH